MNIESFLIDLVSVEIDLMTEFSLIGIERYLLKSDVLVINFIDYLIITEI